MTRIQPFTRLPLAPHVRQLIRLYDYYRTPAHNSNPVTVAEVFLNMGIKPPIARELGQAFERVGREGEPNGPLGPQELRPTDLEITALLLNGDAFELRAGEEGKGTFKVPFEKVYELLGWRSPRIIRPGDELVIRNSDLQGFSRTDCGAYESEQPRFFRLIGIGREKLPTVIAAVQEFIGRYPLRQKPFRSISFSDGITMSMRSQENSMRGTSYTVDVLGRSDSRLFEVMYRGG